MENRIGQPVSKFACRIRTIPAALGKIAILLASSSSFSGVALAEDSSTGPWTLQQALGDPEGLTVSGSIRVRYEAIGNQFRPGLNRNDDIVLLRTDLFAEYDTGPVRIGAELQDSRAWSTDRGSSVGTGEVNALELVQAYAGFDLDDALGEGTDTKLDLGRFTMNLGSRRLVARNNYRNTTNAFTGINARFRGHGGTAISLFYTLPQVRLPNDKPGILDNKVKWDRESFDLVFWGAYLSARPIGDAGTVEAYFLALDEDDSPDRSTRDRHLFTLGARIDRSPVTGRLDYELESAYQFGTIRAGISPAAEKLDVSAYFVHAEAGYRFPGPWAARISFHYDLASGDGPGKSWGRFDTLFGARRGEFGPTGIFGALGRANISSPGVRLEVKPGRRWDAFSMYRAAWLASASDAFASTGVRDPAGLSGNFAGHQIEGRVRYWIIPSRLQLEAGAVLILNGEFLTQAPNANRFGNPRGSYVSLDASF